MDFLSKIKSPAFLADLAERAAKTFAQFYLGFWLFLNPDTNIQNAPDAFDTLFTTQNLKAGVVGLAFSLATSVASATRGSNASASLVD